MATIKKYKAMMEYNKKHKLVIPDLEIEEKRFKEISILLFSLTPELIRVIELADETLNNIDKYGYETMTDFDMVKKALSEIRKLKGE